VGVAGMSKLEVREVVAYDTKHRPSPWFQAVDEEGVVHYSGPDRAKVMAWVARRKGVTT